MQVGGNSTLGLGLVGGFWFMFFVSLFLFWCVLGFCLGCEFLLGFVWEVGRWWR